VFEREGHLSNCDLRSTRFEEVDLSECWFEGSKLNGAKLAQARLRKANLDGTDLRDADFTDADLAGASLRRANLCSCILTKLKLFDCDFSAAALDKTRLQEADLRNATFREAVMEGAYLGGAWMEDTKFNHANLRKAYFDGANLTRANLSGADLSDAVFERANLTDAVVTDAILKDASLERAILVRTDLTGTLLTGAKVYGIAAWDLELTGTIQKDLIITPGEAPNKITVDDLEVAQFMYLLLNNQRVRKVIDTITSKVVLILGRFTPERKAVLDAFREELRKRDYLPVVFDFEKPSSRDPTETVSTLAHMAKFVIADLTDAKSLPQELATIVPFLPSVPVQPILLASNQEWSMYEHFPHYPWVLDIVRYEATADLLKNLAEQVIEPAVRKLAAGGVR
jgi:uncharacterized protein YjbI with pentapeptide repeats